ncbi:hypothetical protein [Azospirillum sp. BE72]|uniref:hypothetical protein n=1 Tax=Azospirillum sp. BE72 TaxID=2817776 RepID=UPI00285B1F4F|nr:hypothetical protein [Azospirillum sp. BE72]MDR6771783.1 hypothetical protein [Azospirillum sp. BE72]
MPPPPDAAQQLAARVLAECGGDEALARLALARLALAANSGMSAGFLRLGPPSPRH